ncbi:Cytochrome P450 [Aspergillus ustus]|uniref:Cytochrome P450 n=1 Tax=Aspergillus ustus TaxID=40382 RepID=A0A0C1EH76_ASPUT|nr:Cytochrome P450 [Aspergillus ustus]
MNDYPELFSDAVESDIYPNARTCELCVHGLRTPERKRSPWDSTPWLSQMTLSLNISVWRQHETTSFSPSNPRTSLSLLVASFFIIDFVLFLSWLLIIYPYFYSPFRHLPRPKQQGEIPIIGQFTHPHTKPLGSTYLKWLTSVSNEGLITYRSILNQDRILLTSPKAIAEVLVSNTYAYTKHPNDISVIQRFLGNGLTISEGAEHRFQRKVITPIYAVRNIRAFYEVFWKKGVHLVKGLEGALLTGGCEVEINQWANRATMDIIGLSALGKDFGCLDGAKSELFETYQEIFTWAPEKDFFMALNRILPTGFVQWVPWKVNERIDATSATLREICRGLVRERIDQVGKSDGKGEDLIARMIGMGGWEVEELVEQLLTIIAAGHETSASAFTWTCYLLSQNQPVQDRLRSELKDIIPALFAAQDPSSDSLATTLENLPYLNAVCNEVLRFRPPVPLLRRIAIIPTTILGHAIPPGTQILLCPYAINRSPELWGPDAGEFKPERWINPETGKANNDGGMRSNYANLTFSHGARSCIGLKFAKAELRTLVAVFVARFRFQLARPDLEAVPVGIVSVRPRDGLALRVARVDGS